jgi:hypothetical protein
MGSDSSRIIIDGTIGFPMTVRRLAGTIGALAVLTAHSTIGVATMWTLAGTQKLDAGDFTGALEPMIPAGPHAVDCH